MDYALHAENPRMTRANQCIAIILGLLGYVIARNASQTRRRSALFAFAVAFFGFAVAAAKHWVTH